MSVYYFNLPTSGEWEAFDEEFTPRFAEILPSQFALEQEGFSKLSVAQLAKSIVFEARGDCPGPVEVRIGGFRYRLSTVAEERGYSATVELLITKWGCDFASRESRLYRKTVTEAVYAALKTAFRRARGMALKGYDSGA